MGFSQMLSKAPGPIPKPPSKPSSPPGGMPPPGKAMALWRCCKFSKKSCKNIEAEAKSPFNLNLGVWKWSIPPYVFVSGKMVINYIINGFDVCSIKPICKGCCLTKQLCEYHTLYIWLYIYRTFSSWLMYWATMSQASKLSSKISQHMPSRAITRHHHLMHRFHPFLSTSDNLQGVVSLYWLVNTDSPNW